MNQFDSIRKNLAARPVRLIEPGNRVQSSVAMILRQGSDGLEVLFIERAANNNDLWSGHIGFPGGKFEPEDNNLQRTAARETLEELGLDLESANILGRLSDVVPGGLPIVVSCFVYTVTNTPIFVPDANEVADAFWVPLNVGHNTARLINVRHEIRTRIKTFPALNISEWTQKPLWGLSFRLLRNLLKSLNAINDIHS